jgi:hypothetical protein
MTRQSDHDETTITCEDHDAGLRKLTLYADHTWRPTAILHIWDIDKTGTRGMVRLAHEIAERHAELAALTQIPCDHEVIATMACGCEVGALEILDKTGPTFQTSLS